MTTLPHSRLALAVTLAAALGVGMLASTAQAFTFEDQTTVNGNSSSSNLNSPSTSRFSSGGSNGQSTIKQGNTTFQFTGPRQSDQRYYPEQLFSPNRPADAR